MIKETCYEYEIKDPDGDVWHTKDRAEAVNAITLAVSVERRKRVYADDGKLLVDEMIEELK